MPTRSKSTIARAVLERRHYRALLNMWRNYPRFRENLRRYLFGTGSYPYECAVRTPLGVVAPTLHSSHDMLTMNEVFCRQDYAAGDDMRVVVDIGGNIGLSALYHLTRSAGSRCYVYEPDPRNVARLRANLAAYEDRWTLEDCAVAAYEGAVDFGREPSGRYGAIGLPTEDTIRVRCRHINDVLGEILDREASVDVLKIDTEGSETETVAAIDPELLHRVGTVLYEADGHELLRPAGFECSRSGAMNRLVNQQPVPS